MSGTLERAQAKLRGLIHAADMGTHYEGCEASHTACAARVVLDALDAESDLFHALCGRVADASTEMAKRGHYDCAALLAPEGGAE